MRYQFFSSSFTPKTSSANYLNSMFFRYLNAIVLETGKVKLLIKMACIYRFILTKKKFLIIGIFLLAGDVYAQEYQSLDSRMQRIQGELQIPGVTLVALQGSEIVYEFNEGVLQKGEDSQVSSSSLFSIASVTKTFTALAIAKLVEEGKISFDDPIKKHLSWFELSDKYVTGHITIRDVLSHRSGLESEGLIYLGGAFNRKETVEQLRFMPLNNRFRASYTYSNILYNALGLIIEEVSGKSWEEYVQVNILESLGMKDSETNSSKITTKKTATSHRYIDYEQGKIQPVGILKSKNESNFPKSNAPAGGVLSSSNDMAKYIQELLNNSSKIVSESTLNTLWEPHTRIKSSFYKKMTNQSSFVGYGLGWFLSEYNDQRIMFHPGGGGGTTSLIVLMPSQKIGIFVSLNLDSWGVFAFANTVLDYLISNEQNPKDWLEEIKPYAEDSSELANWYNEFLTTRVEGTSATLSKEEYTGVYTHQIYGSVSVELINDQLIAKRGNFISDLTHWHYDTFKSIDRSKKIGLDTITFFIGSSGQVDELMIWDVKGFIKERKNSGGHH